jgi:hypothetical protein
MHQLANALPSGINVHRLINEINLDGFLSAVRASVTGPLKGPDDLFRDVAANFASVFEASGLRGIIDPLLEHLPPNWPDGIDPVVVETILNQDGLPLVWVPRKEIVELLVNEPNRASRVHVLLEHSAEIVEDCSQALDGVTHGKLAGQLPLARKALATYAEGQGEAAQALSVLITETAVSGAFDGAKYAEIVAAVEIDMDKISLTTTRLMGALAPVGRFYTSWWAHSGTPAPEELSRHVTVHHADISHFTDANALIAVMLMASILRQLSEYYGEADLAQ